MTTTSPSRDVTTARTMILPLALAQFIASYAATNMNVAISSIASDLGTTVRGVQTVITFFTLVMASLMIPGSKLSDIFGRKKCFIVGLLIYGIGALLALLSQGLVLMGIGYSLLEGVGSALMIPPIYILVTVAFTDVKTRAKYFGVVSGAGGLGSAAGPLIGGIVTTAISWRASFGLQVLVVAYIIFLARRIVDPPREGPAPAFDVIGAVVSAAGLFSVVFGILLSGTYGLGASREDFKIGNTVVIPQGGISPVWLFVAIGAAILALFFVYIRSRERQGKEPLLHTRLFRNRTANCGLGTQLIQWLIMQGTFFVSSVYLQEVRGYNAIQTGLALTPATIGILVASARAERLAGRRPQSFLIVAGFLVTSIGAAVLLILVSVTSSVLAFVPGLLLIGLGVGVMLTSSVNVVQSSFPDADQGDISGLSRSVSNLGSSLGTALAGSIVASVAYPGGRPFAVALGVMLFFTLVGFVLGAFIPGRRLGGPAPAAA